MNTALLTAPPPTAPHALSNHGVSRIMLSVAATLVPASFASRSHSAQSTALRAAPAGMAAAISSRVAPPSISARIPSIAASDPSTVSP